MKGTVQAIIRADDGTARPFSTIQVDDVDAAVSQLQAMASTAAAPAPETAPATETAPAASTPDQAAPEQAPAPIVDQTAVQEPASATAAAPALTDRVATLEEKVAALEAK